MRSTTNLCTLILVVTSGAVLAFTQPTKRGTHNSIRCGRYRFHNETSEQCQDCSLCAPGNFMKSRCRGNQDTKCRQCRKGYFATSYTRFPGRCRKCSDCGMRPVIQTCTKKTDTMCGECPLGTYWEFNRGRCVQCSYCYPDIASSIPLEPECQNPGIPTAHQCTRIAWKPYEPPYLISKTDKDGNEYFISSADVARNDDGQSTSTTRMTYETTSTKTTVETRPTITQLITEAKMSVYAASHLGRSKKYTNTFPESELFQSTEASVLELKNDNLLLMIAGIVAGTLFLVLSVSFTTVWCIRHNTSKQKVSCGIVDKKDKLGASYAQLLNEKPLSNFKV